MKKRFASFVLSGKAATLPMLPTGALAAALPDTIFSNQLHLLEQSTYGGITMLSAFGEAPEANGYGGVTAAQVLYPGYGCSGSTPRTMNLVVTGLSSGEDVYIFASTDKDAPLYASSFPGARFGLDLTLVAAFSYVTPGLPGSSTGAVSVPVNLSDIGITGSGQTVYLQAAAGAPDDTTGWYTSIRFSELDEIKAVTNSCAYDTPSGY